MEDGTTPKMAMSEARKFRDDMAKVGAQWRGFVSAIGITCIAGAVGMWSLGWLDRDVETIGRDLLTGARHFLKIEDAPRATAPDRAEIYYSDDPGSRSIEFPDIGSLTGDVYERMMQNHADRGAVVGTASVVDGDTLSMNGKTFRLWAIDAPELAQACAQNGFRWACGQDALKALRVFINGREVACYEKGREASGRILGQCFAGNYDLSGWQVRNGWAMAVRAVAPDYVASEAGAKFRKLGVWRDTGFEAPWEWRKRQ